MSIKKGPSRHEHERGAPLTKDCDIWCKGKYKHWKEQQEKKDNDWLNKIRGE